jgi:hypothetical protein
MSLNSEDVRFLGPFGAGPAAVCARDLKAKKRSVMRESRTYLKQNSAGDRVHLIVARTVSPAHGKPCCQARNIGTIVCAEIRGSQIGLGEDGRAHPDQED